DSSPRTASCFRPKACRHGDPKNDCTQTPLLIFQSCPTSFKNSGVSVTPSATTASTLRKLGKSPGLLGDIYAGAQSRFKNPVNLKKLIGLIDETEWTALDVDVKAAAYEGLLEKAASEGKKGA